MVRLGWLYVNRGKFGGTSLVSEAWVDMMEQESFDLYPVKGTSFRCKGGMNGQMLLCLPKQDRAVGFSAYMGSGSREMIDFCLSYKA